jgi:hypothetical protein
MSKFTRTLEVTAATPTHKFRMKPSFFWAVTWIVLLFDYKILHGRRLKSHKFRKVVKIPCSVRSEQAVNSETQLQLIDDII